jgi:hypothetical protein
MKTQKNRPIKSTKQMCNKTKKSVALCITHDKLTDEMADRLDILKQKCEQEIRETEDRLRFLKAKLANLVTLAHESEKLANPESNPDKFRDMGLTEAVLQGLKDLWGLRKAATSPVVLKQYLLAHGFVAPENYDTAIYTVLARLVESGQVETVTTPSRPLRGSNLRIPPRKLYRPKLNRISGVAALVGP